MQPTHDTALHPWYKQFWPWFLIFFPALAVVGGISTIIIAVQTDDGLVEDDYYKSGLAINRTLAKAQKARELELQATASWQPANQQIRLTLRGHNERIEDRLILKLAHPTIAGRDIAVPLQRQKDGTYHGMLAATPSLGYWHIFLVPEDQAWRLRGREQLPADTEWQLLP